MVKDEQHNAKLNLITIIILTPVAGGDLRPLRVTGKGKENY